MESIFCNKCHEIKPGTEKFFGHNPEGGFRRTCRSCRNDYNRRLHKLKPGQTKVRRDNYRDRLAAAEGSYTDTDITKIRISLNDSCFYCGDALKNAGEKDHIIPLSKNGSNRASNITLACRSCNRNKCDKLVSDFVKYRRAHKLKIGIGCIDYLNKIRFGSCI